MPRILCWRIVLTLSLIFCAIPNGSFPLTAAEYMKDRPVLPGEKCKTTHGINWTEQERWVWTQVCENREADLNQREGGSHDPKKLEVWTKSRILRPSFLETILLHEQYQLAVSHRGIRITGAWFIEPLDLSDATLTKPLGLHGCRFDEEVILSHLKTHSWISLGGSIFNRTLSMHRLQTGGSLRLNKGAMFHDVQLSGAIIGDVLDLRGSTFADTLDMNSLRVGTNLAMNDGASFHKVQLSGAEIEGEVAMEGSTFRRTLLMTGMEVRGSLFMEEASFTKVDLRGARIEGQVIMVGSTFSDTLDMDGLHVGDTLNLKRAQVTKDEEIHLPFAMIASNLNISESSLSSFNLTGTQVKGEFHLGSNQNSSVKWREGAKLVLRNTEVGSLQDRQDAWPNQLVLDGFTYIRLGGLEGDGASDLNRRDVGWFKEWLAKQQPYSPQPYEQLAGVLRQAGQTQKARDILYESKERERTEVASRLDWFWLTLLKIFIGYGYRTISCITLWVLVFTGIGTIMLKISKDNPFNPAWRNTSAIIPQRLYTYVPRPLASFVENYFPLISYSFDRFLPIIRLRESHYTKTELQGWLAYYFYFHQLMGFVLASLLFASITGLTTK
jgi:uncharacterized protein YjbI with pentapeptide repeats